MPKSDEREQHGECQYRADEMNQREMGPWAETWENFIIYGAMTPCEKQQVAYTCYRTRWNSLNRVQQRNSRPLMT
jgi:hypothetical protein